MQFSFIKADKTTNSTVSLFAFLSVILFPLGIYLINDAFVILILICAVSVALAWLFSNDSFLNSVLASLSAWTITLILTKSAFTSIVVLIPFTIGLFIGLAHRKTIKIQEAVGYSTLSLTVITLLIIVALTVINTGRLDLVSITESFPYFFDGIKNTLYNSFTIKIADTEVQLITPIDVQKYLNVIIAVIPGIISALFSILAYIVAWLYSLFVSSINGAPRRRTSKHIIPSVITTVFFIFAALITGFTDSINIITLTCTNITIILLPLFLVSGIGSAFEVIEVNGFIRPRLLRPLVLLIAFMNSFMSFLIISATFAAYDSIKSSIKEKYSEN